MSDLRDNSPDLFEPECRTPRQLAFRFRYFGRTMKVHVRAAHNILLMRITYRSNFEAQPVIKLRQSKMSLPSVRKLRWGSSFVFGAMLIAPSLTVVGAEDVAYNYGKHKLQLLEVDGGEQLLLDGKVIVEDSSVAIETRAVVGGVPVVIGESHMGGNACAPWMFLIAFPPGGTPTVHTGIGDCGSVWLRVEKSSVHFTSTEFPGLPGMHVMWSPATGLKSMPDIVFKPDPKKDWSSVAVNPRPQVVELFDIPPVADLLYRKIRGDADDVMWIVNGWGEPGRIRAGHYIGDSCHRRNCADSRLLIVLDLKKKHAFVAWSHGDREKVICRPAMSAWSGVAREELERWKIRSRE